jgi:hypothetical protein
MAKPAQAASTLMNQKVPKKNSVLFECTEADGLFQNVYLMRLGASNRLGVKDLDSIKKIEVTVKVVE